MTKIKKDTIFDSGEEIEDILGDSLGYYNEEDFTDSENLLLFYQTDDLDGSYPYYANVKRLSNPFTKGDLADVAGGSGGSTYLQNDCNFFEFLQEVSTESYKVTTSLYDIKINTKVNYIKTLDLIYPVGSVYVSREKTHPGTLFGGNGEQIVDKFPYYNAAAELSYDGNNTSNIIPYHNHANFSFKHNHNLTANTSFFPVITNAGIGEHQLGIEGISTIFRPTFARVNNNNTDVAKSSVSSTVTATVPVTVGYTGSAIAENNNMPPYVTFYAGRRIS